MNAIQDCKISNCLDENENPTGGYVNGTGLSIDWQNGPLGRHAEGCEYMKPCVQGCTRVAPSGAFVETVISAALQRIEFYQASKFKCRETALAITKLEEALHWLESRTKNREKREVEGLHKA